MSGYTIGNGYDEYTSDESGAIYTSRDRAGQATAALLQLTALVQGAQRGKGFSITQFQLVIREWEEVGQLLRSSNYHEFISPYYLTPMSLPNQDLLTALKRLSSGLAGDTGAKILAFNAAQMAFLSFVYSFRRGLSGSAAQEVDAFLRRWKAASTQQIQAGPAEQ